MSARIAYARPEDAGGYHKALDEVARERIYLNMVEAPTQEKFSEFFNEHLAKNYPVYLALEGEKVVGWADISPGKPPMQNHRGFLGMGVVASHRGKGLGSKLLQACLAHARKMGLEKVELNVYTENAAAIALYEKLGFVRVGLVKHYRKLEGRYFDCVMMEIFLS